MDKKTAEAVRRMVENGYARETDGFEAFSLRDGCLARGSAAGAPVPLNTAFALGVIRLAATLDCDVSKELKKELRTAFGAAPAKSLLREEMTAILAPPHGARGLKIAAETGLLPHILGAGVWESARGVEREEFMTLVENLELARPETAYRWALLFRRFDRKRMEAAVMALRFDADTERKLLKTLRYADKIYFLNTKLEFKRFVNRCGFDDYYFIDRVARQEKKIFDRRDLKIENRLYILEEIKAKGEPLTRDDLAVGEADLLEGGICASGEECARILSSLMDLVIVKPRNNRRDLLLEEAARIKKNPLRLLTNKVNWIK
ncbi:MAG: hypothetical protein LBP30_01185 [Clostridiales Family XIII bacterium]|jgi:hypothetical protein|nr:hypothetical protein [Clostridiales Family XIII bacterium]